MSEETKANERRGLSRLLTTEIEPSYWAAPHIFVGARVKLTKLGRAVQWVRDIPFRLRLRFTQSNNEPLDTSWIE